MPHDSQAETELAEIKEAVRWVVTQQADDLCWMDVYVRLGKFVGVEITLEQLGMLPRAKMLSNCDHFIRHMQAGVGYAPEGLAEENDRLRAENADLRERLDSLRHAVRSLARDQ